jgi:hypothetical protein
LRVVQAGHGSHPVITMPNIAIANPAATKRLRMPPWSASESSTIGRTALASRKKPCVEVASRIAVKVELMPEPPPLPKPPPDEPPVVLKETAAAFTREVEELLPPTITADKEKFTVPPAGTLIGSGKVKVVIAVGGATVTIGFSSSISAVSVMEESTAGSDSVTVTLLNSSKDCSSVLV